ncbi:MAG: menaquinone biosynthesis protein, partial [Planctomycetales bacterium]
MNAKPLVHGLEAMLPKAQISYDLPSRLADRLTGEELDLALVPSIELADHPDWQIVSDACIGCEGPVMSVKLLFRVVPRQVRSLALDEGSRTSAALAQILLHEIHQIRPQLERFAIGTDLASTDADAVLLIGDRAIDVDSDSFAEVWDLGELWCRQTKLPFDFALWVARSGIESAALEQTLEITRDQGCLHIDQIARQQSRMMGLDHK